MKIRQERRIWLGFAYLRTVKRLLILFLFCILSLTKTTGQLFSGQGGLIPDASGFVTFDLPVSGLPNSASFPQFGLEQVCIDLVHSYNDDLEIYLKAPDNSLINLASRVGGDSDNFLGTCFRGDATLSVFQSQGPFSGIHKPIGILGNVNNGQNPNGIWQLMIRDVAAPDEGSLLNWSLLFSSSPAAPFGYTSGNLPLVRISTQGTIISNGPKIMARMEIVDNGPGMMNGLSDPANAYRGWIGIEKRGKSSAGFPQAQYNVETRDSLGNNLDVSILGMPEENDWVLYAPYNDKSLMRNVLTYELGRRMGRYASRWRFCEVFVNGNYQGVYTFFETIKRDFNRVNIANLKATDVSGAELTGGYICSIDWPDDGGWFSQFPPDPTQPSNNQVFFQYVEPPDDEIQPQQRAYIASFVDSFERALYSPQFTDPASGWRRFAGEGSFADFFLMNELSKNVDGYRLSTFFYKEKITDGNKIHMGPLWDFNLAWRNADYCGNNLPGGWAYQFTDYCQWDMPNWWRRLMEDQGFKNRLKCRWQELRTNVLSNNSILNFIDSTAARLEEAQQRQFTLYPIMGIYLWPNPSPLAQSYAQEISLLKSWITQRLNFLDNNLPGLCQPAGVMNSSLKNPGIRITTDPNNREIIIHNDRSFFLKKPGFFEIYDTFGKLIGSGSISFDNETSTISAGLPQSSGLHHIRLKDADSKLIHQELIPYLIK